MPGPQTASDEWAAFTPAELDASRCMARTWAGGRGGQCKSRPGQGGRFCTVHGRQSDEHARGGSGGWHGAVDGPVPPRKLVEFQCARKRASA